MGENSKIEWTDHTFNPWIGCTKVSPGCANCYAERDMERYGKAKWGAGETRVRTAASTWAQPLKWDRTAAKYGTRMRVFCASLSDVFDPEVPIQWLADLMVLIEQCRNLDWLILTKRPQEIEGRLHEAHAHIEGIKESWDEREEPSCPASSMLNDWTAGWPPNHIWLGTTVEDQKRADERIPALLKVPASVHFLSCEPLLGHVKIPKHFMLWEATRLDRLTLRHKIGWIICGGESGPHARPMHPDWARSLRDQAQAAGVPFLFKQWGEWLPINQIEDSNALYWPAPEHDPEAVRKCRVETGVHHVDAAFQPLEYADWNTGAMQVFRVGKQRAGRALDGRTWDEVPHA